MKTRRQQTLKKKGARPRPAKRAVTRRRPAVARGNGALARAVALAAECTVAEADTLKSELARRLGEPETVTLDVSALKRIDTAGLQLLAAFVRDRRTAGRAVAWHGRAAALATAAEVLGLDGMLELPGEADR